MKAQEAIDGQIYDLPGRGKRPAYPHAICTSWNHTKEWMLFVVRDEKGDRKITMVMPDEDITGVV